MPDPSHYSSIGLAIAIGFFVLAGVNQVLRLADRFREKPDPKTTYMTKEEARANAAAVDSRLADIEARQEASRTQRESDRTALRSEMQAMRTEIRDDIQRIHERLDEMPEQWNSRIDGIPERVIATLRNTGAIGSQNH